jgi:hypothetical protein
MTEKTEHEGLPVEGYRPQNHSAVETVNGFKRDEEEILQKLDAMAKDPATYDPRWLAIGRTQLEQAFMAINRSVFKPDRAKLLKE